MKRVNGLWAAMLSDDNLRTAILEVVATHRWVPRHKPNKTAAWMEVTVNDRVKELRQIMADPDWHPNKTRKKKRYDHSAGKWRDICEPLLWPDQCIHHAIIQVLGPIITKGLDPYCCGSVPGRGIHYGLDAMKKWMKEDPRGTKFCLEMDIRHFYDSLKPEIVMNRLRQLVKDGRFLAFVERSIENGIEIGVYTSQWFANMVLQPLDHALRQMGVGVSHDIQYMDNFTLYGSSKRKLHKAQKFTRNWLNDQTLALKGNWQIFPTNPSVGAIEHGKARNRPPKYRMPSALGYRLGHGYTRLRKKNQFKMKRELSKFYRRQRKGKIITAKFAAGLLSRMGQLKHCNHYHFQKAYIRPKTERTLKDAVRLFAKKEKLEWSTYLEQMTSTGLAA